MKGITAFCQRGQNKALHVVWEAHDNSGERPHTHYVSSPPDLAYSAYEALLNKLDGLLCDQFSV